MVGCWMVFFGGEGVGETPNSCSGSFVDPRLLPTEISGIEPGSQTGGRTDSSDGPASGGHEIVIHGLA